ncbi:hypothetical protein ACHWQZ_G014647 [Mnemiopsis leidyi]
MEYSIAPESMFCYRTLNSSLSRCSRCTRLLPAKLNNQLYKPFKTISSNFPGSYQFSRTFLVQPSRTFHTTQKLSLKTPHVYDPIKVETNVVGLVNPEMMNRMKVRYPVMWVMVALISGSGLLLLKHPEDLVRPIGVLAIVTSLLLVATMWYNARNIGKLALNQDATATISHLNMYGRRVDKIVPVSDLQLMTRLDHKQVIGKKMYYINWDHFKTNDSLWQHVIPAQKERVLLPDYSDKKSR